MKKSIFLQKFITKRQMYEMERIKNKSKLESVLFNKKILQNNMMKLKPIFFYMKIKTFFNFFDKKNVNLKIMIKWITKHLFLEVYVWILVWHNVTVTYRGVSNRPKAWEGLGTLNFAWRLYPKVQFPLLRLKIGNIWNFGLGRIDPAPLYRTS